MTKQVRGTKSPITLRRVLPIAAVLLVFALVFVTPAAADTLVNSQDDLNQAIANANDPITIILGDGTYSIPEIRSAKELTFTGSKNAIIKVDSEVTATDCTLVFNGITVNFPATGDYTGLKHTKKVVYNNCNLTGQQFMYAPTVEFTNCVLENKENAYCVWTYSSTDVTFTGCKFETGGKAVLVYNENSTNTFVADIKLTDCVFNDYDSAKNSDGSELAKAAVETGQSPYGINTYHLEFENCEVTGFAENTEGIPTGTTLWGNKHSMNSDRLTTTIDGIEVTKDYTITFFTNGGTPIDSITGKYNTDVTAPADPKKAGVEFAGWYPEIPEKMPAEDMTIIAQWKAKDSYAFVYTPTVPATIFGGETLSIPIKLENNEDVESVVPTSWYITVTVNDSDDIPVAKKLDYDLTVNSTYANPQTDGFADGNELNKFHVVGMDNAKGTIDELFTITISGLDVAEDPYTVKIKILSEIRINGNSVYGAHTFENSEKVSVQKISNMVSNFYGPFTDGEETIGQWSLDTKAWAQITVKNNLKDNKKSFNTTQSDVLVKRGTTYDLSLFENRRDVTIFTVDENGESKGAVDTTISKSNDGYIILNVGDNDKGADHFIIELNGRKVGDIANSAEKQDTVDATDAEAMLAHCVADETEIVIQPGYEVYADINMDGKIGTADATFAYLKGVNKLDSTQEATFLLKA